jgi:CheY-like chemotaxis protein
MALFTPSSKVQRDRTIMRESDILLVQYSKRGLGLTLLIYAVCLTFGYLRVLEPVLTAWLTAVFFVLSIIRSYFLFRFEPIYAKGPGRWRNMYFFTTLLGGFWWCLIIITLTVKVGMLGETPILWIYTIILVSTSSHFLAPYKLFSHIFQFILVVPSALTAFWVGGVDGYMYGVLMLAFYILLYFQVENLSDSYWQRLTASYELSQRTKILEAEKRNIDASVDLSSEFLTSLGHEFRTSLSSILGGLSLLTNSTLTEEQHGMLNLAEKAGENQIDLVNNIVDFAKITNRSLILENAIFNLRTHIELWISELSKSAHDNNIELDYQLTTNLPLRVNGDSKRIHQIVNNLLSNAIKFSEHGLICVEVSFDRDTDEVGMLNIIITDTYRQKPSSDISSVHSATKVAAATSSLWLALCKGLSECMGGTLEVVMQARHERQYLTRIPLDISNRQPAVIRSFSKLHDQRVLLIGELGWLTSSYYIAEMERWGMVVEIAYGLDAAKICLSESAKKGEHFNLIVFAFTSITDEISEFIEGNTQIESLKKILLISHTDYANNQAKQILAKPNIHSIFRPVIAQQLHDEICLALFNKPISRQVSESINTRQGSGKEILLVDDHRVNQMVAIGMLKKLDYSVSTASNGFEALKIYSEKEIDLILMDCQMPEMDGFDATKRIREIERSEHEDMHVPIIAMTAHTDDSDKASCFACGMDDYLAKPVRYEDLETHLKRWLGTGSE